MLLLHYFYCSINSWQSLSDYSLAVPDTTREDITFSQFIDAAAANNRHLHQRFQLIKFLYRH